MDLGTRFLVATPRSFVVAASDIGRDLSCGRNSVDSSVGHNFEGFETLDPSIAVDGLVAASVAVVVVAFAAHVPAFL